MIIARQSTARTVTVGPILDADGAAVTDAVVGDLKIAKNGGAPAALNGSATLTHRATGHYSLALTSSDLDTVGQAEIVIDDTTNAMPVKEITVVEEAVYDGTFAASAGALATAAALATVDSEVGVIDGIVDSILADTGTDGVVVAAGSKTGYSLTATTGLGNQTATITGNLSGSVGSVTGAVGSVTGNVGGNVTGSVGSIATGGITAASFAADALARLGIIAFGTAQAATGTTLQLASASTFADDELIGSVVVITGGTTGVGQSRVITDYVGSTDTATVDAWTTTPTGTITYVIFAAPPASATALPSVNVAQINSVAITGDGDASPFDVS